jgi:hypothetical protein
MNALNTIDAAALLVAEVQQNILAEVQEQLGTKLVTCHFAIQDGPNPGAFIECHISADLGEGWESELWTCTIGRFENYVLHKLAMKADSDQRGVQVAAMAHLCIENIAPNLKQKLKARS